MASPTGVIPDELFTPGSVGKVMDFLKAMPIDGDKKELYLIGWARWVGVSINVSQRAAVRNSGIDRVGS
jgi:hypothetical protein